MRIEVRQSNNKDIQVKNLNKALKILKKKLDKEGVFKLLKEKRHYIKFSEIKHQKEMKLRHEKRKKKRYGKKR